ncbi:MAG: hypothetical protein E7774_08380 [Bradyrhizobium sp.]|nr:MAG: hypothetical protein E7774_08380 [Bradyrhizobium sp.]
MTRSQLNGYGALILALTFASGVAAQAYGNYNKTMPAGRTLQLGHYASVNGDCSSKGRVEIRVTREPSSGVVRITQRAGYSHFSGDYQQCSADRVFGASAAYTPQRDFIGSDSFQFDIIYPSGRERFDSYTITVK